MNAAFIDWLSVTFLLGDSEPTGIIQHLSNATGLQLVANEKRSRPGFKEGLQVKAFVNYDLVPFCVIAWGGESQRGRAMIDISGGGCGCIDDWESMQCLMESLEDSRITRCDVSIDLFDGKFTVDDAKKWYSEDGLFNFRGRKPKSSLAGDWINQTEGRTLTIGKRANGKQLCIYEKGKQLGAIDSDWNRFEVRFGNRDREIPFDILTNPTKYFVAAYPALEQFADIAGEKIATISKTAKATVEHILECVKHTYGKWFHIFKKSGLEASEIVESITISEVPDRIQASAVVADVLPDTTKQVLQQEIRSCN